MTKDYTDFKYEVFRVKRRVTTHIFFIHPSIAVEARKRLNHANRNGVSTKSFLMYMADYVLDVNRGMIKNRYPDQPWPQQCFDELFNGVGEEV